LKDTLLEDEIKEISSSVGTWKLRVAYLIWLINEDFSGCQFSQHRPEIKILKQNQKEDGKEDKTREKRK